MLSVEREALIIQKLQQHGKVLVNELAQELGVTTMTIRRDLNKLEQQGVLQKFHGGAVLSTLHLKEQPFIEKRTMHAEQKRRIAQKALLYVHKGDTILLDAGTTTFELASFLTDIPGIQIVTIDLHIALELCASKGNLFFIGGKIEKELGRAAGAKTLQLLDNLHVDTVFLGISAISPEFVLESHTFDNAELKRAMLKCASKKVLLADKSKFDLRAFAQVGPLHLIDTLITDKHFTEQECVYLERHNISLGNIE